MNSQNSGKLISLSLFILASPFFFELFYLIVPPSSISFAEFIKPSLYEYMAASAALLVYLLISYCTARYSTRIRIPFKNSSFFRASEGMLSGCVLLLPILTILSLAFLFGSLRSGLTEALLAYRSNEVSIGYFGYFVLYYFPVVLAITWRRNKAFTNTFCLILLACSNLVTGFRTLLISSLILILVYNFDLVKALPRSTKIIAIFAFLILFVAYEGFRTSLEWGGLARPDTGATFLDSLNRSFPIRYTVVAFRQDVSATFSDLLSMLASPFSVLLQKADGLYDVDKAAIIEERVVRPYLVWRGTPGYAATGFSIHVTPYSFLFFGVFGLAFFSSLIGLSLGLGANLYRYSGILPKVSGTFLITFALSSSESFVSAYTSLCYRFLFLIPLVFFSAFYPRTVNS